MRQIFGLLIAGIMCFNLSCAHIEVGVEEDPDRLEMEGLATAYVAMSGIRPYDGTLLRAGILSNSERDGEIASIEIWPLLGIGVGIIGARLQVLPVEAGLGILFYDPDPVDYAHYYEDSAEDDEEDDED